MITELKNVLLDDFWIMPQTPKYTGSGIPYVTSKNIKGGKINFENVNYISIDDYKKISKNRPILKNDILISMIGTLGETAIVDDSYGEFYGQNMFLVRLDNSKIDYRYFINFFKSTHVKNHLARKQNKSTQSYLKANHIESLMIPVFTIKEQKEIANQLDKVQDLIKLKTQQIEKLDELIKSQFVEMFENQKFDLKTLNEISVIKGEYGSGASAGEFVEGQPRYVRITDIQEDGRLNNQSMASPKNENNIDKYILKYGDILFARTGATVGKTYKYNENDGYCIYAGYCIRFRLDLNICNPDYIFIYTKTDNYKKWVENKQRVVAQPNINAKEYGNDLKIPIPPIELQNKFAEFVKQIDKQKFEIQKSLDEIQELYESLMDKYFG